MDICEFSYLFYSLSFCQRTVLDCVQYLGTIIVITTLSYYWAVDGVADPSSSVEFGKLCAYAAWVIFGVCFIIRVVSADEWRVVVEGAYRAGNGAFEWIYQQILPA
jgi:hypothetical protein